MTQQIYTASLEQRLAWLYRKVAILSQEIPRHNIRDSEGNIDYKYSWEFKYLHQLAKEFGIK